MEIIYYTGRGLCPYLTFHSLPSVTLSLVHFLKLKPLFHKISLPEYTNTNDKKTLLVIKDIKKVSSVKGGKKPDRIVVSIPENTEMTCSQYLEFVDLAKPSLFVSFSEEGDFSIGAKRAERTAKNALDGLLLCLNGGRTGVLANVQGGQDVDARKWCLKEMMDSQADGIYFGGCGIDDHGLELRQLLKETCAGLNGYMKIKVLSGMGRPLDIIYASSLGFTSFEAYYPFYLSSKGQALNFSFSEDWEDTSSDFFSFQDNNYSEEILNLSDPQHQYSKEPLVHNCSCPTCKNHSRGYLYHLLSMKELTASTLLCIHNSHIYEEMRLFLDRHSKSDSLVEAYSKFVINCCVRLDS
jgi:queuine tRNA-ribosyltransferase subunit QTRTD1